MTKLTLISSYDHPLKPLVEAALNNEVRILESGIRRTEQHLKRYESQHRLSTDKFIQAYENNQLEEKLEFTEWIGEYRMLERLKQKAQTLREVNFVD